eukprot:TRINITY_DN5346_c0_g1_i1.p1 TRINITY_DN5346_c0_g1~~TRINITY_DN5346_c0_g1_i1.p1  ORF type:complete len:203 (-),score=38.77 TRINITY_DN5346_c0_g1_i1:19-627(-)
MKEDYFEIRQELFSKRHRFCCFGSDNRFFIPPPEQRDILAQGSLMMMMVLKSKYAEDFNYVIANTHLSTYRPIQLFQARLAMEGYQKFIRGTTADGAFLCGDFNSGKADPAYKFISTGRHHDKSLDVTYNHPFRFSNAYADASGDNPTTTKYGALDHIFYTDDKLVPVAYLELPKNPAFMTNAYPSDHAALMVRFEQINSRH